jgi:hypothetical protein
LLGLIVRALLLVVCTLLRLTVRALLLIVRTLLALVVATLLVRPVSLISRTRAGVALILVAAAVLSIALRRLCDRPAHTQRKCQSSDRNKFLLSLMADPLCQDMSRCPITATSLPLNRRKHWQLLRIAR